MALPPTIPTSFVPKQAVSTPRKRVSGTNPFLALSYVVAGVAVLACFATFGYQYYLEGVAKKKADQVVAAQNQIDQGTVTEFIRLRDRFTSAKDILNKQIALSQFFDTLENLTLSSVRFSSLEVTVGEDRVAHLELKGSARTFNALAAQSAAFAAEKRIKRAIFSGISVSDTGGVTFNLVADLDPALVVVAPKTAVPVQAAPTQPAAVATSTPATTPSATSTAKTATTTKP